MPLTTSDNLLSNTSPEDVLLCKQTNKVYSMSKIAFKMDYMAQWVECQTRHQSIVWVLAPSKDPVVSLSKKL